MRFPKLNPIRFYKEANLPNWATRFPNLDNVRYGESYTYSQSYSPDCIRKHIGKMYLQFEMELADEKTLYVYKLNEDNQFEIYDSLTPTDISPAGWITKPIYEHLLHLPTGTYYASFPNIYRSDYFQIVDENSGSDELVRIDYSHSTNKFGCVFGGHFFTAYFKGDLLDGEPAIKYDSYTDDDNIPLKLNASPQNTATLSLVGVHYTYKDLFDFLFSLNTLMFNGVVYENVEAPSISKTKGSDLREVTIKLSKKTNDPYMDEGVEFENPEVLIPKYGRLYNWHAYLDPRNIAPEGWHIPTWAECLTLKNYLGGFAVAGGKMKEISTDYWEEPIVGDNASRMSVRGGGVVFNRRYYYFKEKGGFMGGPDSVSQYSGVAITHDAPYFGGFIWGERTLASLIGNGGSIRCVKDDSVAVDSLTDIDGNVYDAVKIGDQVWMAENLRTTKFRNGDSIQELSATAWASSTPAWAAYDDDHSNI